MADADTIVVLDGIMNQKETTSDIYTQDHTTNSSVYQNVVVPPLAAKAIRVIFNGAYDPNGGRFHIRTKLLRATDLTAGSVTKTANQQEEWQTLTPPAVVHSTEYDISASYDSVLCIDVCQSSVTANTTGLELIVQVRMEDSLDEWTEIRRMNCLSLGAATKSDFKAQEAAAQTILSVTTPTTGNLDHVGKLIFLEDTATIAKCEIAFIVECGADA